MEVRSRTHSANEEFAVAKKSLISTFLKTLVSLAIIGFLSLAALELSLTLFLDNPEYLHGLLKSLMQEYSMAFDRDTVQLNPACAKADAVLTYILKPGQCRQKSREFDVQLSINSQGTRDDEDSLRQPEIIVTGDSQAMGWGVEQEKNFAQLLESATGKKVLNAAVPSYSTSREIAALARYDLSKVKTLIIQYCDNDYGENLAFFNDGRKFPVIAPDRYQYLVNVYADQKKYYFGKHTWHVLGAAISRLTAKTADAKGNAKLPDGRTSNQAYEDALGANLFVDILNHAPVNLDGVQIILMEVNSSNANDAFFIDAVKAIQHGKSNAEAVKNMVEIDLSKVLKPGNYYNLDDHMNASGHAAVMKQLLPFIH